MIKKPVLTLMCLFSAFLADASTLDAYGSLTSRTILMPYLPPSTTAALPSELPPDKALAVEQIEAALSKAGVAIVQDGPSFTRLFPDSKAWRDLMTNAPLRGAQLHLTNDAQLAPGSILFMSADTTTVLGLYSALKQRTILRPANFPTPPMDLKTQCGLSKEEAVYALETLLVMHGLCAVDDGGQLVQIIPLESRALVKTGAPKRDPAENLFDPNKVPSVGNSTPQLMTKTQRDLERWREAFYTFIHYKDPRRRPAKLLLEFYAKLTDKTVVSTIGLEDTSVWFHVTTPLTRSEMLYAIETTFKLNRLAIKTEDDGKIRLSTIAEPGKADPSHSPKPNQ